MYISLSLQNFNTPRRPKMWKSRVNDGVADSADDHVDAAVYNIDDLYMIRDELDRLPTRNYGNWVTTVIGWVLKTI